MTQINFSITRCLAYDYNSAVIKFSFKKSNFTGSPLSGLVFIRGPPPPHEIKYVHNETVFFLCSVSVETDNKNGTFLCHFLVIVETLDSFIKFGRKKIETGVPRRSRVPPVSIFCSAEFNETCPKFQQFSKKWYKKCHFYLSVFNWNCGTIK